eukprot:8455229-Alexandrium_andersonii.AAC.1
MVLQRIPNPSATNDKLDTNTAQIARYRAKPGTLAHHLEQGDRNPTTRTHRERRSRPGRPCTT